MANSWSPKLIDSATRVRGYDSIPSDIPGAATINTIRSLYGYTASALTLKWTAAMYEVGDDGASPVQTTCVNDTDISNSGGTVISWLPDTISKGIMDNTSLGWICPSESDKGYKLFTSAGPGEGANVVSSYIPNTHHQPWRKDEVGGGSSSSGGGTGNFKLVIVDEIGPYAGAGYGKVEVADVNGYGLLHGTGEIISALFIDRG